MTSDARLAANQALFRSINERIAEESVPPGEWEGRAVELFEFLCECSDETCDARVGLSPAEYENLRSEPTQFVVVPGHERADIEVVVEENERFVIVRKEVEEDLLRRTDPAS